MNFFFAALVLSLLLVIQPFSNAQDISTKKTRKNTASSSATTVVADSLTVEKKTETSTKNKGKKAKEKTVYITNTGKKYHAAGCRHLRKRAIPLSLSDAVKQYEPCSVCRPPTE